MSAPVFLLSVAGGFDLLVAVALVAAARHPRECLATLPDSPSSLDESAARPGGGAPFLAFER
jgi:hypothetical protein